jgi:hypothetical protein
MKRTIQMALVCMAAAACAAERDPSEMATSDVEITGCLTGKDNEFYLTELDRADTGTTIAAPSTESYRLMGEAGVLRQHVGKQVRVAGLAKAPDVAIIRETSPAAPAGTPAVGTSGTGAAAGTPGETPKVSIGQETRLEVSSLQVRSVTPTGGDCTALGSGR